MSKYQYIIDKIREIYKTPTDFIPLHEPRFIGNEKKYLNDCIDSTFVSSVGKYVTEFEERVAEITGASHGVAVVNGTAALHLSLEVLGVSTGDLVVTQALSFVATANAILYTGASPYFVDIDRERLGMSSQALEEFFKDVEMIDNTPVHKPSGKRVAAIVPMHTFGIPAEIDKLVAIADRYMVPVIEDSAEAMASYYKGKHVGTFGKLGVFSFNGNKIVTSGGGGMIVTNDPELAKKAKHLSTQAKVDHKWEFKHDQLGYNYRCPNLNAALALAQLEQLELFAANKRKTFDLYSEFFKDKEVKLHHPPVDCISNNWLNALLFPSKEERDAFLSESNSSGVMTRPAWNLLNTLDYLKGYGHDELVNSNFIESHLVNIPSSVRI